MERVLHSERRLPARRQTLLLCAVVVAMIGLRSFAGNGLPFAGDEVSCIKFRYDLMDSTQIVIDDPKRIAALMSKLRADIQYSGECLLCEQVVFADRGEEHTAFISPHSFVLLGEHRTVMRMPSDFYRLMSAYRDSVRFRRPWDGS